MKIYFGRIPDDAFMIDSYFPEFILKQNNYNMDTSVAALIEYLESDKDVVYYSCNPLIFNFMDEDFAKEHVYIIDGEGNHIKFGGDEQMLLKLTCMGVGEVLCDDARSLI
jgi:transcription initiation factor IIE alpha subunit